MSESNTEVGQNSSGQTVTVTTDDIDFPTITFSDLFAGIGGLRLAWESAGARCVWSCETDRFAKKTYEANFGDVPDGDIREVVPDDIPDFDVLVAGFPCQPFSIAGVSKNRSLGRKTGFEDETRGTLFFEICRLLDAKRPKAFMLENVKNLASHDKGRTFDVILRSLDELGYEVSWKTLDAKGYVPQHRERMVIVGIDGERYPGEKPVSLDLPRPDGNPVLADILEDWVDPKYTLSDRLWGTLRRHKEKHEAKGNGFGYGLADPSGVTRTLSARYYKDGSEILIPQEGRNPRRLTPRECARLQGFPESFVIPVSNTQAYKQFGNSVAVPLMSAVANRMAETLRELDGPPAE